MTEVELVTLEDIRQAATVIDGVLHRTPLLGSTYLGGLAGVELTFKLELFQKTGSFKPRGVLNNLHHMSDEARTKGVVSLSAGNHAQAVAWAATGLGISSVIVMPAGAVRSKIEATQGYGGEVILTEGSLLETAREIQEQRDLTMIHPFDSAYTIAGQGTVGLELMQDTTGVHAVFVGIGGGGLISGVATAVKAMNPEALVIGVEPEGAPGMTQSLATGEPARLDQVDTIADGLAAPFVGAHNLAQVEAYVDRVILVSDDDIRRSMRLTLERCKVMPEPAGAAALAGLLSDQVHLPANAHVVCIISGGNVDLGMLKEML